MADLVVLVVEDGVFIRMDAALMLEDAAGFEALEASNADDALELLEARPDIRIVFTDIEMPGSMNGLRLSFVVRNRWPPIAIIIASGRIQPEAHEMPADVTFLRKPYRHAAVLEAIELAA